MSKQKKILLIQLRQLGDILLTTPCIREIRKENPSCHMTFLCHDMGLNVLRGNPYLDQVISYHENDSLRKKWATLKLIRQSSFDLVIDFMNVPRSALFCLASMAPVRIATKSSRRIAYTRLIPRGGGGEYIVQEKFKFLKAAGIQARDIQLDFPWFEADLQPFLAFLKAKGGPNKQDSPKVRVILSPTHRRAERKWPKESYLELAKMLVEKFHAEVSWIWGPGESDEIDHLIDRCAVKTWKAPSTKLSELAAFVANHDLFIGNSNGPSHIAVACQTPSLQLHGPTRARSWCPQNKRHRSIQAERDGKSPSDSIKKISLEQVEQSLNDFWPEVLRIKSMQTCEAPFRSWNEQALKRTELATKPS